MSETGFRTIEDSVQTEISEKKSRFITNIFYVESKQSAEEIIKNIKAKYYDARHNCYAYSVLENGISFIKCSDDGEPSGTAGEPILNVIKKNNLQNILIIVTRYFGGILLGAGGLVRAYSNSAINGINSGKIVEKTPGYQLKIKIDYENNEKFKYYCNKNNIVIISTNYDEDITYKIELNEEEYNKLKNQGMSENIQKTLNLKYIEEICRKYV